MLLAGIVGLVAGLVGGRYWNSQISPLHQAEAPLLIEVEAAGGKATNTEIEAALADATALAIGANREEFAADFRRGTAGISANANDSALTFFAQGRTSEEARSRAGLMRATYLVAAGKAADTQAQLQSILEAARAVDGELTEIARLEEAAALVALFELTEDRDFLYRSAIMGGGKAPPAIPEEILIQARVDVLEAQVDALNKQIGSLAVDLSTDPDDEEAIEDIATLEDAVNALLAEVEKEEALLAVVTGEENGSPQATTAAEDESDGATDLDWRKAALEARQAELQAGYEELFDMVATGRSVLPAVVVSNLTGDPFPLVLAGLLGLIVGLMAALALVIVDDRMRRPIWLATEGGAVPILGEVPSRPRSGRGPGEPWYPTAPPGPRKAGVQRVLAGLMGFVESRPGAIGVAGLDAEPEEVRELAIDLSASTAMSEYSVLVIDAIGEQVPTEGAAQEPAMTIASLLALTRNEPETTVSRAKQVLAEARELAPGLRMLASGDLGAETVMSRAFASLLDQAKAEYALTVVAVPRADDSFAAALWQRLDGFLPVIESGRTKMTDLGLLSSALKRRHADLLGAVLLRTRFAGRLSRLLRFRRGKRFSTTAPSS